MIAVILGRTKMRDGICIGGYLVLHKRSVRLIPQGRYNNPLDDDHEIGQLWDIEFNRAPNIRPPHTEDIIVTKSKLVGPVPDLKKYLMELITPYRGAVEGLYDGLIRFTGNGSGYIAQSVGVTNYSTCFWITDKRLYCSRDGDSIYYQYYVNSNRKLRFKYVGLQESGGMIEKGTLVRMSLARWWAPDPGVEDRCYVQLSGWF